MRYNSKTERYDIPRIVAASFMVVAAILWFWSLASCRYATKDTAVVEPSFIELYVDGAVVTYD